MKVLERLVLAHLRLQVEALLDQFAYQPNLGVYDAVIYLLRPDGGGSTLQVMGVDTCIVSWIADYLTDRPQFVRMGSVLSDVVVSDTGAPVHLIHH